MSSLRVRFAPSPTGMFHVGSARSALFNWILAKQSGGTFVLRVEDTDEARNQPEWTQGILDALAWLGISPSDEAFEGPYYQSANADAHVAAARRLAELGAAYYCDCTRDNLVARTGHEKHGYDRHCRDRGLTAGLGRALRFRVPEGSSVVSDLIRGDVEFDHASMEDFVVLRANGSPLFLIANVVDDITHRISLVVRGEEHFPNTPKQQLMWQAFGETPPVWAHVPVLVNEARKKLSKRRDKVALEQFRDEGFVMEAMRNYLMTLGWTPKGDAEIVAWDEMVRDFSLADVVSSPAFFDLKKLAAFNGDYIRAMAPADFIVACEPWLAAWRDAHPGHRWSQDTFVRMAPFVQERAVTLADAPGTIDFVMLNEPAFDAEARAKTMNDTARALLADVVAAFATSEWQAETLKTTVEEIGAAHGLKRGPAQGPVRLAVTGRLVGPPLYEPLVILGRNETIARLRALLAWEPTE